MLDADDKKRIESAARFGDTNWGREGSAFDHERYALAVSSRRRCDHCPGKGMGRPRATHAGMANGVALTSGCEWHVRQWVRDPRRRKPT